MNRTVLPVRMTWFVVSQTRPASAQPESGGVFFAAVPHLPCSDRQKYAGITADKHHAVCMTAPIVDSCSSVRLCSAQAADQPDVTLALEELYRGFEQAPLDRARVEGRCSQ
jgi:hypothetical protein